MGTATGRAGVIYQSAIPIVTSTSNTGTVNIQGAEADSSFYTGVDFQLTSTTTIDAIGGHFYQAAAVGNQEIFGAIVAVSGLLAAPADPTLATGVLGHTLITLPPALATGGPVVTDTVSGSLDLTLAPGYYAVLFGSGLFGATGAGTAVETVNGVAVNSNGVTFYSLKQPAGTQILQAAGARFFVSGAPVPEPTSIIMAGTAAVIGLGLASRGPRRRQANT